MSEEENENGCDHVIGYDYENGTLVNISNRDEEGRGSWNGFNYCPECGEHVGFL